MSEIRKMELYDEFQCIAGQCGFTCCSGWDITVDTDTYDKWSNHGQAGYFNNYLKVKNQTRKPEYSMKLGPEKRCPFLDNQGLCNIVSTYGDEYLPNTCRTFPRLENRFGEIRELSLSCACPVVVTMIEQLEENLSLLPAAKEDTASMPFGYQLRNALLAIHQDTAHSFKDRILLGFQLLMDIKDEAEVEGVPQNEADVAIIEENIIKYMDPEYQKSLIDFWDGIEVEQTDSWLEVNELFLDICKNYRKETGYQEYLQDIYEFAEILDTEEDTTPLDRFRLAFDKYDRLMKNCFVAKLFASCVNDDIDQMILSYQMLVTEYVMTRYATFLRWLMHEKKAKGSSINSSTVRDNIVCFSRIIGYNTDGMKEFWEESFDDAIWELGYLILLVS
jgi:lysine-N-methylase